MVQRINNFDILKPIAILMITTSLIIFNVRAHANEAPTIDKEPTTLNTQTANPIVLAHGMLGFKKLLGVLNYFGGVKKHLESNGATVYTGHTSAINSSEVRGQQLIDQLDQIRRDVGQADLKFNLVGHSQGGLDIRYVAGMRPDLVASLTSIGTPHKGVSADALGFLNPVKLQNAPGFVTAPINLGVRLSYLLLTGTWKPMDIKGTLNMVNQEKVAAFNKRFPGGISTQHCETGNALTHTKEGTIRNYSWTGTAAFTNPLDILDPGLWAISKMIYPDEASDGLVGVCSAKFGQLIETGIAMNHLDEMNIFITGWGQEKKPLELYKEHANRLGIAGL